MDNDDNSDSDQEVPLRPPLRKDPVATAKTQAYDVSASFAQALLESAPAPPQGLPMILFCY